MLDIASERDSSGDVFLQDMGGGLPFRPGVFDGCISISAVQWLCYSDKKEHTARKRLTRFFTSLYTCLKAGSRAVLQLYPETPEQMEEISGTAMRCGFSGGLVIDFPNSAKAKKFYLCLFAGYSDQQQVPQGLGTGATAGQISYEGRARNQRVSWLTYTCRYPCRPLADMLALRLILTATSRQGSRSHQGEVSCCSVLVRQSILQNRSLTVDLFSSLHFRDWVLAKKERYRKQGKKVKADSKFTGRKRPGKF
ncbi:unnamed protein product [Phytophthora fragariaefolia]|uniref:Unnamed protein product n=1 Tax=Phytophthora fragariaefolia TaxID=1490495 RepID=A0A9W7CZU8_9STRA|nr:unnamed protein product [Phytophthora fragariaefolia]